MFNLEKKRGDGGMSGSAEAKKTITDDGLAIKVYSSNGGQSSGLMQRWGDLRTDFVLKEGWLTEGDLQENNPDGASADRDRYDLPNSLTYHVLVRKEGGSTARVEESSEGELVAGARLTRILSVKDSLSREMVQDNPVMLENLDLKSNELGLEEIARRGDLWDVTRMISNEAGGGDAQRKAVLQILGAAVAIVNKNNNTRSQEGAQGEPHWIFTTTSKMRAFIEWGGMRPVGVLSDGELVDRKGKRERILVCTLSANKAFGSVLKKVEAEKDRLSGGEGKRRSYAGEIAFGCKNISGASGGA